MRQSPDVVRKVKMRAARITRPIKSIILTAALLSCFLFMSASLRANLRENPVHPRYYTLTQEQTVNGERIPLANTEIYTAVDPKSIITIMFDKEKLFKAVRALAQEDKSVCIRIEAYIKPQNAEKHPITVEKYSTVVKKTH